MPETKRTSKAKRQADFICNECGKKFYTVKSAEKASYNGCPKCNSCDIDVAPLNLERS